MKKGLLIGLTLVLLLAAAAYVLAASTPPPRGISWSRTGGCSRTTILYDETDGVINCTWGPGTTSGHVPMENLINHHTYTLGDGCWQCGIIWNAPDRILKTWDCLTNCI